MPQVGIEGYASLLCCAFCSIFFFLLSLALAITGCVLLGTSSSNLNAPTGGYIAMIFLGFTLAIAFIAILFCLAKKTNADNDPAILATRLSNGNRLAREKRLFI